MRDVRAHIGPVWHVLRGRGFLRGLRGVTIGILLLGVVAFLAVRPADAIQGGTSGIVMLGRGPGAGILFPPGFTLQDTFAYNSGNLGNQHVTQWSDSLTLTYITHTTIFGGTYGAGINIPEVSLGASPINASAPGIVETTAGIGDIKVMPLILGWQAGDYHTLLTVTANLPTGAYNPAVTINPALPWFGVDTTLGVTYLNPKNGLEVSVNLGYTINWINPTTNYLSGNQVRLETAFVKHFPNGAGFGILAYGMTQTTPDTGAGDHVGAFEGQVYGAGPVVFYTTGRWVFSARYFYQFGAVNEFQGNQLFLTGILKL